MKTNIPSVNGLKHYVHDLSHDVNTTSDWGFCQPLVCQEIQGKGSKITIRPAQVCRLMPMVFPTFGRIEVKNYSVFVPIESVYHPYGSFRAQQTYQGSNSQYIPDMVISASSALHSLVLKCLSQWTVIHIPDDSTVNSIKVGFNAAESTVLYPLESATDSQEYDEVTASWKSNVSLYVFDQSGYIPDYWLQYRTYGASSFSENAKKTAQYDWIDYVEVSGRKYLVCGKYTIAAKNIRKVLIGCGYQVLWDSELLSFLPLLAYYKGWFDLFHPQRDITWKDTNAAALQEYCEQYGIFNLNLHSPSSIISVRPNQLFDFYLDLAQCYYTQSPDFVSAHITGQATDTVASEERFFMGSSNDLYSVNFEKPYQASFTRVNSTATLAVNDLYQQISQSGLQLLRQLSIRNNAKSLIGGDVEKFLKEILGTGYKEQDDSFWIGSSKFDVNVQPVFSNAETEDGWLGEFAGQGSGSSNGDQFTYINKYDGFVLTYMCVVPESRMCQGINMNLKHVKAVDFYDKAFDHYTLLPTSKKFIYAQQQFDNLLDPLQWNDSFGNIPNYIEYRVAPNVQNGDFSLRSTRETYQPFTLDRLLPGTESFDNGPGSLSYVQNLDPAILVNSPIWRYVGLYQFIGNYNRIFKNSGIVSVSIASINESFNNIFYSTGFDDNIVIDCYLEFKVSNIMDPISDSMMLIPFDGHASSIEMA